VIKLSELAVEALHESLHAGGIASDQGLRLKIKEGRFTLYLDKPADDDRVIRHDADIVLIVDRETDEEIGNAVIDVIDPYPEEPELVIRRQVQD
jgi:hypothetical protein